MMKEETGKQITIVCQMLLLPGTEAKQGKERVVGSCTEGV